MTSASTSSTFHSSIAAIETRCWASTSSGFCGDRRLLDLAFAHPPRDDRALEQVAAVFGEDPAFRDLAEAVAGAADPLQAAGDRLRRLDLDHEVDGAHVDAELRATRSPPGRAADPTSTAPRQQSALRVRANHGGRGRSLRTSRGQESRGGACGRGLRLRSRHLPGSPDSGAVVSLDEGRSADGGEGEVSTEPPAFREGEASPSPPPACSVAGSSWSPSPLANSFIRFAKRSDARRLLTKMIVEVWDGPAPGAWGRSRARWSGCGRRARLRWRGGRPRWGKQVSRDRP